MAGTRQLLPLRSPSSSTSSFSPTPGRPRWRSRAGAAPGPARHGHNPAAAASPSPWSAGSPFSEPGGEAAEVAADREGPGERIGGLRRLTRTRRQQPPHGRSTARSGGMRPGRLPWQPLPACPQKAGGVGSMSAWRVCSAASVEGPGDALCALQDWGGDRPLGLSGLPTAQLLSAAGPGRAKVSFPSPTSMRCPQGSPAAGQPLSSATSHTGRQACTPACVQALVIPWNQWIKYMAVSPAGPMPFSTDGRCRGSWLKLLACALKKTHTPVFPQQASPQERKQPLCYIRPCSSHPECFLRSKTAFFGLLFSCLISRMCYLPFL